MNIAYLSKEKEALCRIFYISSENILCELNKGNFQEHLGVPADSYVEFFKVLYWGHFFLIEYWTSWTSFSFSERHFVLKVLSHS